MRFSVLLFLSFWILMACRSNDSKKLTIAVSANMQEAAEDLKLAFYEKHGIECDLIIGSSGKLTAQIMEGAPYDVFLAADLNYPQELYKAKMLINKPTIYAIGKLALYSSIENINPTLELLTSPVIKHISLANPKTAPYGKAALEVLIKRRILEKVSGKLVYGESISQTNQFIESKAAEIGFTSLSTVINRVKTNAWIELPDSLYSPINQGIAIIKQSEAKNVISIQFRDFLMSKKGKEILKNHGYSVL